MSMYKNLALVVAGLAASLAFAGPPAIEDSKMGLAGSVFDTEEPMKFDYSGADPDHADTTLPAAFADAPPQIPHTVNTVIPITMDKNKCLKCHDDQDLWGKKKDKDEASPMPESHYVDFRNAPGKVGKKLIGSRYFCMHCHVPQAEVKPLVENEF